MMNLVEREKAALFPTYDRLPIGAVTHAEGVHIHTEDGTAYLDAIAGLGVNALGHSHPALVAAIREQAGKYLHLSNLYLQEPQVVLAEKLARASGFERVFFTNSGTEAVEGAIKVVRRFFSSPTKTEVIGVANGFHGRTYGPLSVMDKAKYRDSFGPFVADSTCIAYDAAALEEAVSARTAAVIIEPIQGEGGIVEIDQEFADILVQLRAQHNFLLIADEIQSGIGRTGRFFAYEHYHLKPDIVVCAKAIGGGLPLGAILARREIADVMKAGVHGTTFGGNPLACVAGSVVLDLVEKNYMDNAAHEGEHLKTHFEALMHQHPKLIRDVRGRGLMLGIEFASGARHVQKHLFDQHIITNVTAGEVLRMLPPLIFERKHSDELLAAIEGALSSPELH
ncbi:MAG: acetylornithine transaminase [Bacteroidota bacterium]|nr:acetylornithine transaminase [Bacteroidota bacterium]MDP4234006.1 acetylornithine transaminase [Bacteroidota bacterium]MDP4242873.1 acetylornithine transaminase [Bacteroidota bacterium]MDP4287689.1 acetylornithine transaminase [Bacteroidota bacterium]